MTKLAIKGHPSRSKEIIEILEMLGGKNTHDYICNMPDFAYSINEQGIIEWFVAHLNSNSPYTIFTLEEFLERFPYKVGNKVIAYVEGCLAQFTIQELRWNDELNKIEYRICSSWLDASLMWLYKEKKADTTLSIDLKLKGEDYSYKRFCYKIPNGYEIDCVKNNEIILKPIKSQYPKTYEECCDILYIETNRIIKYDDCLGYRDITQYDINLLTQLRCFRKLLICRDAYWKIAGDQMGLGKPWEPDWRNAEQDKFVLYTHDDVIWLNHFMLGHNVLAFPTAEMRDTFYENFKSSIEDCKELL